MLSARRLNDNLNWLNQRLSIFFFFLQDKYGYEQDLMTFLMDLVITCDRRVSVEATASIVVVRGE